MSSQTQSSILVAIAGVACIVALWFLAIAPKRSEHAKVSANVAAQEGRLATAKTQVATYAAARKQFPGLLSELKTLDKAVPSRGAISNLLRQLQRRARVQDSDLRLAALKDPTSTGTTPGAAAPVTPGATTGLGGLAALPFTFEYTGAYFDLLDILREVRRSVSVKSGDLKIDGRLITIDGLTFKRTEDDVTLTKAVISATAYIAPDGAPKPPATATTTKKGGS